MVLNTEENLLLIKNVDKTDNIDFCKYENGKWTIKFQNNRNVYNYHYNNVIWLRDPKIINHETAVIYENNHPITGIIKILDFGEYVKFFFKTGYKKAYKRSEITFEETCLSNQAANHTFEYLKMLANHLRIGNDQEISFLRKQYNELKMISSRSVLSAYLDKTDIKKQNKIPDIIFPFGFNKSQKSATEKALTEQISIIEGPPGTGKTQTILNIIANAIINNRSVAVVSNNNSATANVLEKLQKYDVDFIAAFLGNKENKTKFFKEQIGSYPNMSNWSLEQKDFQSIKESLRISQQKLNEMLELQNKRARLTDEKNKLRTEYEYFKQYYTDSNFQTLSIKSLLKFNADKILKILLEYKMSMEKGKITLWEKIYNFFFRGIYHFKIYKYSPDSIIAYLQKLYYEKKISEINHEIDSLSKNLANYNFEAEMKDYSSKSMDFFKAKLADRFAHTDGRAAFTEDVLWRDFGSFIKEYPVVLSTTHSLRYSAEKNYLFDYVIIDEASQVDIVTGALALSCAKNAVIVGDANQLPNVVPHEVKVITDRIFETFQLNNAYQYSEHSLLTSALSLFNTAPRTLLKEHYRCHPKIIGFCNQKFYHNDLVVLTDEKESDQPLVLYKTAKGNHARGRINQRQIDMVINEIIPEQKLNPIEQSIGIISPYRLQAEELQKAVGSSNIEADTVHKYQGREKDVIILTTVANHVSPEDFIDDPNLINVAVSRAVEKLIVAVSEGSEGWAGTNIGDLIRYIQYNNFEVTESQIYSVFDLLYSSYSDKLLETLRKSKKVSEYKSENLMNSVIKKVLSRPEFQSFDWVLHQPLRMLIKDPAKLNNDEFKYAMNMLTHTDFVIFNTMDKMPILVVEVDGHAYHANNPAQLKRDKMKDEILKKYNIPIIRMKTTESREEERLQQKLREILHLDAKATA